MEMLLQGNFVASKEECFLSFNVYAENVDVEIYIYICVLCIIFVRQSSVCMEILWRRWASVLAELRSEVVSRGGKMDCQGSSLGTKVC